MYSGKIYCLHQYTGKIVRIISARKATKNEEKTYKKCANNETGI